MTWRTTALVGLIAFAVTTACSPAGLPGVPSNPPAAVQAPPGKPASAPQAAAPAQPPAAVQPPAGARVAAQDEPSANGEAPQPPPPPTEQLIDPMVVRSHGLTLAVLNVYDTYRRVESIALDQGGLVTNSQLKQEAGRPTATMVLRVPADKTTYLGTLDKLRGLAREVIEEQIQSQDVTDEYLDVDTRLRNLQASGASPAQIAALQTRRQSLERRAFLATITVQLREFVPPPAPPPPPPPPVPEREWSPDAVFADATASLGTVGRLAYTGGIYLLVWLPVYGPPLLLLWLLRRRLRHWLRASAT